jgi:hypothetical protein
MGQSQQATFACEGGRQPPVEQLLNPNKEKPAMEMTDTFVDAEYGTEFMRGFLIAGAISTAFWSSATLIALRLFGVM